MFLALWYYLHGYVMITVSGFSVERFVNMATFRGIYLWNIQPKGSSVQMNVSTKGYTLLEECAEKTGCKYDIVCRCGLPALIRKYKKRKVLTLGVLFFIVSLYTLSSFVWTVEVEGNERIEKEDILIACENMGMSAGKLKWNMHTDEVTQKLLEIFPDISWVSVSIKGTNALIKIVESIPQPEMIDKVTPSDLVAKKDSVIQNITVESGTPVVKSGDVVKKGTLLISGEVIIAAGEEAEVGREYIHARGTILGKVWYTLEESIPLQYTEKRYTGEERKDKSIMIGDTILNIIQPNMEGNVYDTEKTSVNQFAIGDFKLPVAYIEETYKIYETIQKQRTEEQAKKELENKLKQKAEEIVEGEIENIDIIYKIEENNVIAVATITAVEEISAEQKREENIAYENKEEL